MQQVMIELRAPFRREPAPLSEAALARIRQQLEQAAEAMVEREERRARREALLQAP